MMPMLIAIEESSDHREVSRLHESLMHAFSENSSVSLDFSRFRSGGAALVQLIYAARSEATARNCQIQLSHPANQELTDLLHRCGISLEDPAERIFWFHGEIQS